MAELKLPQIGNGKMPLAKIVLVVVILAAFVGIYFFGTQAGEQEAAKKASLEKEIANRIGAGLKVETKTQATQSLATISQELETTRGTLKRISQNLEGAPEPVGGPSGLLVYAQVIGTTVLLVLVASALFVLVQRAKKKT